MSRASNNMIALVGDYEPHKMLHGYHEGNGDPNALLLRIVDQRDAASGGWPSIDMSLNREDARALFNWLGVWLHREP